MKSLKFLLCALFLVFPVIGAQWSSSALFVGDIGVISNNEHSWRISNQDVRDIALLNGSNHLYGAVGDGMVSGKGLAGFKTDRLVNSDNIQQTRVKTLSQASNGGVAWDDTAMTGYRATSPPLLCDAGNIVASSANESGTTPYSESIQVSDVVMGHDFIHNSHKGIEQGGDSDLMFIDLSGSGNNSVTVDVIGFAAVGFEEGEIDANYAMFTHEHYHRWSNTSQKYSYSGEWDSFSDTFKDLEIIPVIKDESVNTTELSSNLTKE